MSKENEKNTDPHCNTFILKFVSFIDISVYSDHRYRSMGQIYESNQMIFHPYGNMPPNPYYYPYGPPPMGYWNTYMYPPYPPTQNSQINFSAGNRMSIQNDSLYLPEEFLSHKRNRDNGEVDSDIEEDSKQKRRHELAELMKNGEQPVRKKYRDEGTLKKKVENQKKIQRKLNKLVTGKTQSDTNAKYKRDDIDTFLNPFLDLARDPENSSPFDSSDHVNEIAGMNFNDCETGYSTHSNINTSGITALVNDMTLSQETAAKKKELNDCLIHLLNKTLGDRIQRSLTLINNSYKHCVEQLPEEEQDLLKEDSYSIINPDLNIYDGWVTKKLGTSMNYFDLLHDKLLFTKTGNKFTAKENQKYIKQYNDITDYITNLNTKNAKDKKPSISYDFEYAEFFGEKGKQGKYRINEKPNFDNVNIHLLEKRTLDLKKDMENHNNMIDAYIANSRAMRNNIDYNRLKRKFDQNPFANNFTSLKDLEKQIKVLQFQKREKDFSFYYPTPYSSSRQSSFDSPVKRKRYTSSFDPNALKGVVFPPIKNSTDIQSENVDPSENLKSENVESENVGYDPLKSITSELFDFQLVKIKEEEIFKPKKEKNVKQPQEQKKNPIPPKENKEQTVSKRSSQKSKQKQISKKKENPKESNSDVPKVENPKEAQQGNKEGKSKSSKRPSQKSKKESNSDVPKVENPEQSQQGNKEEKPKDVEENQNANPMEIEEENGDGNDKPKEEVKENEEDKPKEENSNDVKPKEEEEDKPKEEEQKAKEEDEKAKEEKEASKKEEKPEDDEKSKNSLQSNTGKGRKTQRTGKGTNKNKNKGKSIGRPAKSTGRKRKSRDQSVKSDGKKRKIVNDSSEEDNKSDNEEKEVEEQEEVSENEEDEVSEKLESDLNNSVPINSISNKSEKDSENNPQSAPIRSCLTLKNTKNKKELKNQIKSVNDKINAKKYIFNNLYKDFVQINEDKNLQKDKKDKKDIYISLFDFVTPLKEKGLKFRANRKNDYLERNSLLFENFKSVFTERFVSNTKFKQANNRLHDLSSNTINKKDFDKVEQYTTLKLRFNMMPKYNFKFLCMNEKEETLYRFIMRTIYFILLFDPTQKEIYDSDFKDDMIMHSFYSFYYEYQKSEDFVYKNQLINLSDYLQLVKDWLECIKVANILEKDLYDIFLYKHNYAIKKLLYYEYLFLSTKEDIGYLQTKAEKTTQMSLLIFNIIMLLEKNICFYEINKENTLSIVQHRKISEDVIDFDNLITYYYIFKPNLGTNSCSKFLVLMTESKIFYFVDENKKRIEVNNNVFGYQAASELVNNNKILKYDFLNLFNLKDSIVLNENLEE